MCPSNFYTCLPKYLVYPVNELELIDIANSIKQSNALLKQLVSSQVEVDRSKYGRVMTIYPISCKEMATRRKKTLPLAASC